MDDALHSRHSDSNSNSTRNKRISETNANHFAAFRFETNSNHWTAVWTVSAARAKVDWRKAPWVGPDSDCWEAFSSEELNTSRSGERNFSLLLKWAIRAGRLAREVVGGLAGSYWLGRVRLGANATQGSKFLLPRVIFSYFKWKITFYGLSQPRRMEKLSSTAFRARTTSGHSPGR